MRKSGVTLSELLKLECMAHAQVVAGAGGLERIVTNVNVMEVPDIGDWINPGDLLLTTAYPIHKDISALANLIPVLAGKGLSGLVLKAKRYLPTIPALMIEQANALGFPLVELPLQTSFADILNSMLSEILHIQAAYFQKSEEAHRLFMEVILKGGRLEDIANTLSGLIDNTVIITDSTGRVLATSLVSWDSDTLEYYNRLKQPCQGKSVDPLASGLKYTQTLVQEQPPLYEFKTEISAQGQTQGHLIIWDNRRPLSQNDFIFIGQAMTVAALEFLNEWSLREIERRYRNEFLDALLSDLPADTPRLIERARYLGWDLTLDYVALVMDIDPIGKESLHRQQTQNHLQQVKERLFYYLVNSILRSTGGFITGTKSDRIILLLTTPRECRNLPGYHSRRAGEILQAAINCVPDCYISLGVGRFYPGITGLRKSYGEALQALTIGKKLFGPNQVINFSQLGVYRLLQAVSDWDELEQFYGETAGPLDQYDRTYNSDLVKTLEAYFQYNGNLKQVAKALYIHYNTILYRMERIEEITGLNLKVPDQRLNLLLGLKIRQILLPHRDKK